MDEVIPGLWIGDMRSALNTEQLQQNKIFSILSAMRGRITIHEGRGVLVHCQAGMSRSATIVAAYLMYTRHLTPEAALELIRKSRPQIDPNTGFLVQLELFHKASFRISQRDKSTRMFYMERAVEEVMNGDGTLPPTDMFAKFPRTPTDSTPNTPGGPRRRIRCKMCRQELAAREHMLDHGQLGDATPANLTPASSRRPSTHQPPSRHPSTSQPRSRLGSESSRPRRPSGLSSFVDALTMSPTEDDHEETAKLAPRRPSGGRSGAIRPFANLSRSMMDSLSMSALETEEAVESEDDDEPEVTTDLSNEAGPTSVDAAAKLGRRMSDAVISSPGDTEPGQPPSKPEVEATQYASPGDLAAQLYANPKLAALRGPAGMSMTPLQTNNIKPNVISPPILANPKCSGYFVEPMKWMEPFLQNGELAGKIICPNKKCGAKLGNYDWAGVCCGCKAWVTPGFCINRSKVDEIVT
ncbi:hypothetical protein BDZ89DRAFT_1088719 [Hymenopellis radicata]|nr:hypothetical protein BDZ89DRAFT_1088719 [Hymenopellis radicata]